MTQIKTLERPDDLYTRIQRMAASQSCFMSKKPLAFIGFLLLVGLLPGCHFHEDLKNQLLNELVDPYFTLVFEGKTEEAYKTYTTDAYKAVNSLDTYQAHYRKLYREKGNPKERTFAGLTKSTSIFDGSETVRICTNFVFKNKPQSQKEKAGPWAIQIGHSQDYFKPVCFNVVKGVDGRYRINHSDTGKAVPDGLEGPW
ncbi:MAG: hypothetical protein VKJ46_12965 [Leptolyngbyaceae bacterium]|nr:hypothetical protein [Leptolyngbyaceae bacterium]